MTSRGFVDKETSFGASVEEVAGLVVRRLVPLVPLVRGRVGVEINKGSSGGISMCGALDFCVMLSETPCGRSGPILSFAQRLNRIRS